MSNKYPQLRKYFWKNGIIHSGKHSLYLDYDKHLLGYSFTKNTSDKEHEILL